MAGAMVSATEALRAGETEWRPEGKVLLRLGHILFEPARSIVENEFKEKEYSEKAMYQFLAIILVNSIFWGVILFGGFYLIKYKR